MVCMRDKLALRSELNKLGLDYEISAHGSIDFFDKIKDAQLEKLTTDLLKFGLIPLNQAECLQFDTIIETIVEVVHYSDKLPKINFPKVISKMSGIDINSIEKVFSDVKGMSLQQFIDCQKIERVKELLIFEGMTLADIAGMLDYKNQEQLVAQFKKITGLSPSYFKRMNKERIDLTKEMWELRKKDISAHSAHIVKSKSNGVIKKKYNSNKKSIPDRKIHPGIYASSLNSDI